MPKGTRVEKCVEKVKAKGSGVNPYAVCQASTKQNLHTGKPIKESRRGDGSVPPPGPVEKTAEDRDWDRLDKSME